MSHRWLPSCNLPTLVVAVAGLWSAVGGACAGVISPALERSLARRGTHADTAVILRFVDPVDLRSFEVTDRRLRNNRLLLALKAHSERNRTFITPLLNANQAVRIKDLWLINGIAATVPAVAVKQLAAHPAVAQIDLDTFVQGGRSQRTPPSRTLPGERPEAAPSNAIPPLVAPEAPTAKPGWNLLAIHAPEVWAQGHTGQGVVVATMDTGVDLAHPDLRSQWRGGRNSWFDPHQEEASPYDALGHGTQALGLVLGGSGIGVAPGARWIAVRLYNSNGRASMSDIHLGFQWLMDPDGDPATVDAPDVVNASWALTGRAAGTCIMEFSQDILALKSAGIAVVFAAGNDGPFPNTSNAPANNPDVLSVGAIDRGQELARQSSRGPSACDSTPFPRLVAPGVNVRTADLSHGGQPSYATVSGSSMAAPHAAGVLALLAGAFPSASVGELEAALLRGAQDLGSAGPDALYGQGRVDALAAFEAFRQARESAPSRSEAMALGL